jgi:hypothetical protein
MILRCWIKRKKRGIISRWRQRKRNRNWKRWKRPLTHNIQLSIWFAILKVIWIKTVAWNFNKSSQISISQLVLGHLNLLQQWMYTPRKNSQFPTTSEKPWKSPSKLRRWIYTQTKYTCTTTRKWFKLWWWFCRTPSTSKTWTAWTSHSSLQSIFWRT